MATANHEVEICRCTHGDHEHKLGGQTWPTGAPCTKCPCTGFVKATTESLKAGEQRRRITED